MFCVGLAEAMQQNKSVRPAQVCGTTTFKGTGKFYICFRTNVRSQMLRRVVAYCMIFCVQAKQYQSATQTAHWQRFVNSQHAHDVDCGPCLCDDAAICHSVPRSTPLGSRYKSYSEGRWRWRQRIERYCVYILLSNITSRLHQTQSLTYAAHLQRSVWQIVDLPPLLTCLWLYLAMGTF